MYIKSVITIYLSEQIQIRKYLT